MPKITLATKKEIDDLNARISAFESRLNAYWQTLYPVGGGYCSSTITPGKIFGNNSFWENVGNLNSGKFYARTS